MTGTTSTTEPGVIAHALRALAEHFEARNLPAPVAVDVQPDSLTIRIPARGAEEWAASLADGDGMHCFVSGNDVAYWNTKGLLPDTGVRVRLTWSKATTWAVPA